MQQVNARILLTLLCACDTACTFSAPPRPLDAPFLFCGTFQPGLHLTCKDARGEHTRVSDATVTLNQGVPAPAALQLDCRPEPISRVHQALMGTALSAEVEVRCDLIAHVPFVSVTQSLTFESRTQRLCGIDQQGSSAIVPLKWTGTLWLPRLWLPRVSTPRFDVIVTANSEVLFPADGRQRENGDLNQGCLLRLGGAETDDFRLGERDVLRATVPAATTVPVSLDCGARLHTTSTSLNTLGCTGFEDPDFASPVEKRLRLTLTFSVSPSR